MNKPMDTKKLIAGVSLIPESAPFNDEQRAWLNGFFAGMTGIEEMMQSANGAPVGDTVGAELEEEEEDFPWHDDALPIDDRMELATDRPHKRKLMAAMAQLDCGSCGYLCQTYAEAIDSGEEANLTLCTPGGKETAKMLKKLVKLGGGKGAPSTSNSAATTVKETGFTRKNPFSAKLIKSEKLTGEGSNKDVRHVEIDLSGSGIQYDVGDALGLYPTNCNDLIAEILSHCDGVESVAETAFATRDVSTVTDELFELFQEKVSDPIEKERLQQLVDDEDQLDELDVLDFYKCSLAVESQ